MFTSIPTFQLFVQTVIEKTREVYARLPSFQVFSSVFQTVVAKTTPLESSFIPETDMRSEESSSKGKVVVLSGSCGKVEEVRVSLCSRSIRFYRSSQETPGQAEASKAEEDGTRPPSVPRSRWLFPEEELPVLQWRRPRRCGVGLGNPHALCFMNAVLQALAYTPGVADDLLEGRHSSRCPLAASTAAARRHARLLQQRNSAAHNTKDGQPNNGSATRDSIPDISTAAAVSSMEGNFDRKQGEHLEGLLRRTTRGGCRNNEKGASSNVAETDSDAAVSFCLLCKLEEQVQSIHCASRPSGVSLTKQQHQNSPTEGVVRGFVRNRFSRYVKQFVWRRYREGRQEDAHEFLRYLLDALMRCGSGSTCKRGTDTLRMPPEVWLTSYFGQLFGGWLESSVCCSTCGYCSRRFDACLDLPLDLTPAPAVPAGNSCLPSINHSNVGGDAGATATGKRRFNSSNRADDDTGGEGPPASKVVRRKIFAASTTTTADGQCTSDSRSIVQEEETTKTKESQYSAVTQTVTMASSRRILFSGGGRSSHEKERRKRSQLLREGGSTIEKALQHFVAQEYLTGENSYSCPQCKQKRPATKQLRVYTPPRVLVLPIKRFAVGCWGGASRGAGCYDPFAAHSFLLKNQAPVAFPAILNLAPYMVPPSSEVATCATDAIPDQLPCSSAALSGIAGYLKEGREVNACVTAAAEFPQEQITQQSSSMKLEKLSSVSERCRSKSHGIVGKEDETSPRSDASTNSTSTRASSSPSPSPSRGAFSIMKNRSPHISASTSVSSSDLCSASETSCENALSDHSTGQMNTTSPFTVVNNNTAGILSDSSGLSAANNGSSFTTALNPGAAPSSATAGNCRPAAPPLYQLYAVVTHTGSSLSSGHYRCFVRAPASAAAITCKGASEDEAAASASMWLLIDDEVVQTVSEIFVLQRLQHDAYLLFYSRIPSAQQQQEMQLKERMEKQQCTTDVTPTTEQGQLGEGCGTNENKVGKWGITHDGSLPCTINSGRTQTRRSVSSASDSSEERSCHSSCGSPASGTGSSCSDQSDETSASSNSTCSTANSDSARWSDDEELFSRCTRGAAARLRSRQYEVPVVTARARVKSFRKSIFSFLQRPKLQQAEGTSTYFSYGKKFRTQRLLALQVSLLLRRRQKQCRLDAAANKDNSQVEKEISNQIVSHLSSEEGGSLKEESQTHEKQAHHTKQDVERLSFQDNLKKERPARNLRILSSEEMRGRMKAASSFANQYGVALPGEWTDEEEHSDGMDEGETDGQSWQSGRDSALERLQELQQPRREVRNRHDREYDRGKVKKVKKRLSTKELAVGETIIVKSRDGDSSALVVHQRAAFDKVIEQQKQGGGKKVRFHTKQQRQGRQGRSDVRAKQNRRVGRKYGQGNSHKRKHPVK